MSHQSRNDKNLTFRSCMTDAVASQRKAGSVGTNLLKLARSCTDVEMFMARCQAEEDWVLSEVAGQMQELELPTCWTQAKSDIKAAWKLGIDPKDVTSYHKMREKKTEINKERKGNGASGRGKGGTLQPKREDDGIPILSVEDALEQGSVVDAKTNMIVPDELLALVRLLNKFSEHGRARIIKKFTDEAEQMLTNEEASNAKSVRARMAAAKG